MRSLPALALVLVAGLACRRAEVDAGASASGDARGGVEELPSSGPEPPREQSAPQAATSGMDEPPAPPSPPPSGEPEPPPASEATAEPTAFVCPRAEGCEYGVEVELRDGPELAVGARVSVGPVSGEIPADGSLHLDIPAPSGARDALGVVVHYEGESVHNEVHTREQLRETGLVLDVGRPQSCRLRFVDETGERATTPVWGPKLQLESEGAPLRLYDNDWRLDFSCPDPGGTLVLSGKPDVTELLGAWVFVAPSPTPPNSTWMIELPREPDHWIVEFIGVDGKALTDIDAVNVIAGAAPGVAATPAAAVPRSAPARALANGRWAFERTLIEHGGTFEIERAGHMLRRPAPRLDQRMVRIAFGPCGSEELGCSL